MPIDGTNKRVEEILRKSGSVQEALKNVANSFKGSRIPLSDPLLLKIAELGSSPEIDIPSIRKNTIGWQDFADSGTSEASPIVQSNVSGGEVQLTNNNNGTATDGNTNINANTTVEGVNDLWDTTTNTFIFKDTGIGKNDLFDIRFNPNVSPNIVSQDFGIRMDFYDDVAGTGNKVFSLKKSGKTRNESAGVFDDDFIHISGYLGESILNGSAVAYFYGSKSFELEHIGHMISIFKISR